MIAKDVLMPGATFSKRPGWLTLVSWVILLWTALGCIEHVAMLGSVPSQQFDPGQMAVWAATPAWYHAAWAVSTWAAFGGAVLLLRRKRQSATWLLVSVIATVVMYSAYILIPAMRAAEDGSTLFLRIVTLSIGVASYAVARHAARRGWLA